MIYLASPYTSTQSVVMEYRFQVVENYACQMIKDGLTVFSPIMHWHTAAQIYGLPKDFVFWRDYSLSMLSKADQVVVLMIDGWEESKGVKAEIEYAQANNIPVRYRQV